MKKLYYLIILTVILGLVLTGCFLSNVGQVPTSPQSGISYLTKHTEGDPFTTDLIADGGDSSIDVGDVLVWNDGDTLYVQYVVNAPWCLTETHLHVADDLGLIPQTRKSNPIPGLFDCNDEHECVTEFLYTIPLNSWSAETQLYIAAHASLLNLVDTVEVIANELPPTCSNVLLESGKKYLLKASGTAFAGDTIDFDAKYSITKRILDDTWTDLVSGYPGYGPTLLNLAVNGVFVDWGAFNEDHVYYWKMDGIGSCVPLWIYDVHYPNNTGSLIVEIYQEETAWAYGERFTLIGNWATYFTYTVQQLPEFGMVLWLDAGKGTTEGSGVSKWEDQSGSDNHAVQTDTSYQPTYITGELNGYPVVRFSGGEKYLRHPSILTGDYTAFYVLKLTESGDNLVYYYHAGSVNTGDLGFFAETENKEEGWGSAGNVDTSVTVRTSELHPTPLDWRIHTHQPEA